MTPDQWMPHGHCYAWSPQVLFPHLIGSALIIIAYAGLPVLVLRSIGRLGLEGAEAHVARLFAAFIAACGVGHVLDVVSIWAATYRLLGWWHVVTGVISALTLVVAIIAERHATRIAEAVRHAIASTRETSGYHAIRRTIDSAKAMRAVLRAIPGVHVMTFARDDEGVIRYTDGSREVWEHMQTAAHDVVGKRPDEWLPSIGAGDILPLYERVLSGEAFTFKYDHGGALSVNRFIPYDGGGMIVSVMLGEIEAARKKAQTVEGLTSDAS